jgi:hypothetical protein
MVALLATQAGAASTLLMLHFLQRLRLAAVAGDGTARAGLVQIPGGRALPFMEWFSFLAMHQTDVWMGRADGITQHST